MTSPGNPTRNEHGAQPGLWIRVKHWAIRLLKIELRIYESIWRAIARRPAIPSGARGFRYHKPVLTILCIFIVLSAVEIPIIDLIVHRWPVARVVLLVLGIWGLTWMLGLLCAYLMRPHTVGPLGIRVREGLELDLNLPWDVIASVGIKKTVDSEMMRPVDEGKPPRLFADDDDRVLALRMSGETNIEVRLEGLTPLVLPGLPPKGGEQNCSVVRFWVDDPEALLDAVRAQIG